MLLQTFTQSIKNRYNQLKAEMDAKRATAKHNLLGSSPIVEVLLSMMF